MTADQFDSLVNHESGLLGVSETSSDVRDLLARQHGDVRAAEAIELFCYQAKKWIGAFTAVFGGLDVLVFAGGIGENSPDPPPDLRGTGVPWDRLGRRPKRLRRPPDLDRQGPVKVRVIRTDEEVMIAKAAARLTARPL